MVYRENANEPASRLTRDLQLDEQLQWSAPARTGLVLRRSDLFLIPFKVYLAILEARDQP